MRTYMLHRYYAAPTMHHAILQEASVRYVPNSNKTHPPTQSVRFVANAAGGLVSDTRLIFNCVTVIFINFPPVYCFVCLQLPVLAKSLKQTFGATILTSYGMTECMPISTPPFTYDLNPSGTSGIAVGPRICIVTDDLDAAIDLAAAAGEEEVVLSELLPGQVGNILVRGSPCFSGYEIPEGEDNVSNEECFFIVDTGSGGKESGWFSTGQSYFACIALCVICFLYCYD